ncbi:MAG: FecR family protein [Candidatus Sericytochromatia bacterium]
MKKLLLPIFMSFTLAISVNTSSFADSPNFDTVIKKVKNNVEIKYGNEDWKKVKTNDIGKVGSILRTGSLSKAEIVYKDGSVIRLGSRTTLTLLDKNAREVKIKSGNFWFKITKKSHGLKIHAPYAIASITGTEGGVKVEANAEINKTETLPTETETKKTSNKKGLFTLSDDKVKDSSVETNNNEGVISIGKKQKTKLDDTETKIENFDVTVVVSEGTVSTKVGDKNFDLNPGDKVYFQTANPTQVTFNYEGVNNVKNGFDSLEEQEAKAPEKKAEKKDDIKSTLSNFTQGTISRGKFLEIKANMSSFQKLLENYALDNGGYPKDLKTLIDQTKQSGAYKAIKNPYNNQEGAGVSMDNYSSTKKNFGKGFVLYQPYECNGTTCNKYRIYGSDQDGNLLTDKNKVFMLNN